GSGGLKPIVPAAEQVERALADAARQECGPRAIAEARSFLFPLLDRRTDPLANILRGAVVRLETERSEPYNEDEGSQASCLARLLLEELAGETDDGEAAFLGSLDAIALRHSVGREIVVQAVRLLEDRGKVELRRGRGGGVV